jgi:hypothetical protein
VGLEESAFRWSLELGGRYHVGAFCRNLVSVGVKMFSHLIYVTKKCYKCIFNTICKDNAAISLVYRLTQKRFISVNIYVSYCDS